MADSQAWGGNRVGPINKVFGEKLRENFFLQPLWTALKRQTRLLCSSSSKPSYNSAQCFSLESFFIPSHCSQACPALAQKEYEASLLSLRQTLEPSLKQVPGLPWNHQHFPAPASPTESSCRAITALPTCLGSHLPRSQTLLRAFSFGSSWVHYIRETLSSLFCESSGPSPICLHSIFLGVFSGGGVG